jgi:molybdopterin-biosynthesis enzyme MoeA-like protein
MEAMFEAIAARFAGTPIASWRRRYRTGEGQIVTILEEATLRHPGVTVGSYPRFLESGPEVEVVLKSTDVEALAAATKFLEAALVDVRGVAG